MAGIFKAYDIRGIYGDTITEDIAFEIGRAFATFLSCKKVVVGRDMRPHSSPMFNGLARGLTLQGANVIDIGLCSTPMSYFANGKLGADASVMITASHNPGEWNGMKLCREKAIPISGATGIQDIERIVQSKAYTPEAGTPGTVSTYDIEKDYIAHIHAMANLKRPIKIVADFANAMGIHEARALSDLLEVDPLFDTLDGTFPNHEANPLQLDTYESLQEKVRGTECDFAVAFDGDADRVGFVDEQGHVISMDMITALVAQTLLRESPGETILYDLRSSWAVKEIIDENKGKPYMSRVGHAFIKQQMRDADAVFAGELSGHYYFKGNYFTESSAMAVLAVANLVSQGDTPLSELIRPIRRYYASGEINSEVADGDALFAKLRELYSEGKIIELDGLSIEFDDWWFNVRASNTEPLVRLNLEGKTKDIMATRRDELLALIRA